MDQNELPTTKVGVLDKAMAILAVFERGDQTLSPAQIAAMLGMPVPSVYRLVQALAEHGLLEKDGASYRLGLRLMRLGALVAEGLDLRRQVLPALKHLNARSGEHVELQIRRGASRIAIEAVRSSQRIQVYSELGQPMPLHAGAAAKALLAWLPPHQCAELIEASRRQFPHVAGTGAAFEADLRETHDHGWAVSIGERTQGLAAVAAPIFDAQGDVAAALILATPALRLTQERIDHLVPDLLAATREASRSLGGEMPRTVRGVERVAADDVAMSADGQLCEASLAEAEVSRMPTNG